MQDLERDQIRDLALKGPLVGGGMGERSEEEQGQWHREGAAAWDSHGSCELLMPRPGA